MHGRMDELVVGVGRRIFLALFLRPLFVLVCVGSGQRIEDKLW